MTTFIFAAVVSVLLVLGVLVRPFVGKAAGAQATRRQLNTAIYREQLARLEQDLVDGTLGRPDHAAARAELQRRMLDEAGGEDHAVGARLRAPRRTLAGIALALPLVAVALYALIGNPAALGGHAAQPAAQQDVVRMVEGLRRKLESEPGNLKGWALLARSYKVMGRPAEAEIAFERAGPYIDDDAQMLADHADVAAANADGRFAGKPVALIAKALKADPDNTMALWLAGTAALERKDYGSALATWQRLMALLAPGSEDARLLQGAIDEVRARGGNSVDTMSAKAAGPVAAVGATNISGTVELAHALKANVAPGGTLMVIARPVGSRMPLAVLRVRASDFPLRFTLDDSLAMSPQALLSAAGEVEVQARISKSGQARPESGDLVSAVQTVKVGARGVTLQVSAVRP